MSAIPILISANSSSLNFNNYYIGLSIFVIAFSLFILYATIKYGGKKNEFKK